MGTPSPLRALAILGAASLSAACQGPLLDGLLAPEISVSPSPVDERTTSSTPAFEFKVTLSYRGDCSTFDPTVRGTINGEPAPQWFAGEERTSFNILGGWISTCVFPSFHLPLEPADADQVTVAFEDGTTRIAATILNLGRAQSLTVTPPPDGHIRPGSTIGLTYAPATDDLSRMQLVLEGPPELPSTISDLSQSPGPSIQYVIPADHPTGPATLWVSGMRVPGVSACEGAAACLVQSHSHSFPEAGAAFQPVSASFVIEP